MALPQAGCDEKFWERVLANVMAEHVCFARHTAYIVISCLLWPVFWDLADQNQHNPHSQALTWTVLAVAVVVACTL